MNGVTVDATSSTTVSPPHPRPAVIDGPLPAPDVKSVDPHQHEHSEHLRQLRRFFIGPMPETLANQPRRKRLVRARRPSHSTSQTSLPTCSSSDSSDDEESFVRRISNEHVREFFLRRGGREEDWDAQQEQSLRDELVSRWNESKWGRIHKLGKDPNLKLNKNKWTGETFEVGTFLGVKLDAEPVAAPATVGDGASATASGRPAARRRGSGSTVSTVKPRPTPTPLDSSGKPVPQRADTDASFQTAHSTLPGSIILAHIDHEMTPSPTSIGFGASTSALPLIQEPASASTSALPQIVTDDIEPQRLHLPEAAKSDPGHLSGSAAVQLAPTRSAMKRAAAGGVLPTPSTARKSVVWADGGRAETPPSGDSPPAHPDEVLGRTPSELPIETSAGAATRHVAVAEEAERKSKDVIMRDRMLLRIQHTKVEGLATFDESVAHVQKDMKLEDWAEFMVVWRRNRIEIYEEYSTPGKEWFTGHKDLAFVISLQSADTNMSLFSPTDMSFAITCAPRPARMLTKRRALFAARENGTNIFIFKLKSRSRAVDWIWRLWQVLGAQLPDTVDIRAPTLGTRTRIELPDFDDEPVPSIDDIVHLCQNSFMTLPEWRFLFETALAQGQRLALAWRWDTKLDWVWLPTDLDGDARAWAVWYGVALRGPTNPTTLEMRLAQHYPTRLVLKDHSVLVEPPAVEGYIYLVKAASRTRAYLSTHDGYIFNGSSSQANPPDPPRLPVIIDGQPRSAVSHNDEVRRGAAQIVGAHDFVDMRSVLCVRRADTTQVSRTHGLDAGKGIGGHIHLNVGSNEDLTAPEVVEETPSDDEDEGGEETLPSVAADKARIRMKRSFELCLRSGHTVRYEAHSRRDALDWISRLTALVAYWTHRHRVDARQEMELVTATTGKRQHVVLSRGHARDDLDMPEPLPDPDDASPALGLFWHWCVLDNCRPIVKSGRLFMKRGLSGQYRYCNLVLVSGHLVQFRIEPNHSEHHHRGDVINLLDAYVCSGIFAMQALPRREFLVEVAPKRYQDGLEADDSEEDTTFLLWYRVRGAEDLEADEEETDKATATGRTPKLNEGRKIVVLKTRSKLERDAWCWAINCELERAVRSHSEREVKIRTTGGLIS